MGGGGRLCSVKFYKLHAASRNRKKKQKKNIIQKKCWAKSPDKVADLLMSTSICAPRPPFCFWFIFSFTLCPLSGEPRCVRACVCVCVIRIKGRKMQGASPKPLMMNDRQQPKIWQMWPWMSRRLAEVGQQSLGLMCDSFEKDQKGYRSTVN